MQYTHEIALDINAKAKLLYVPVKQFDEVARVLHITVTSDGESWTPERGYTASLRILKDDGLACYYPVTIEEDGTITAPLKDGALTQSGPALADIVFSNSAGTVILSTASFFLDVQRSGIFKNIEDMNEFQELLELTAEAKRIIAAFSGAGLVFSDDGNGNITIEAVEDN